MKCIINYNNITARMSRPDFLEPMPILENIHIKFEDLKPKLERRKPVIKKRIELQEQFVSLLGKRNLEQAFGSGMKDKERYGQEIPPDFFKFNRGHNVFQSPISLRDSHVNHKNLYETKINYWREKYQTKR
jgi:hypothetical protein